MSLSKDITLNEGEAIISEITGPGRLESSNPIVRIATSFIILIGKLLGFSTKTTVLITDQRVLYGERRTILYFLTGGMEARSMTKRSIQSIGFSKKRSFLIFTSLFFLMETSTYTIKIRFKQSQNELNALVGTVIDQVNKI